jgi:hypothetical protein
MSGSKYEIAKELGMNFPLHSINIMVNIQYKVQKFNSRNGPVKEKILTCALVAAVIFEILSL